MKQFIAPRWASILNANQLVDFEALWHVKAQPIDGLNQRQGGYSYVNCLQLILPDGQRETVYIKRQLNYFTRELFTCRQLVDREFTVIQTLQQKDIGCPDVIYYAHDIDNRGNHRAILVTRELAGFVDLEQWLQRDEVRANQQLINLTCAAVAQAIRRLHAADWLHYALYGKHIFVKQKHTGELAVCFLDLEKARRAWFMTWRFQRELSVFMRRTTLLNRRTQQLRFLQAYLNQPVCSTLVRRWWRVLHARVKQHLKNYYATKQHDLA
ncbi:MAG: lipopolysaccharide kinase InaA family protein [Gammaproteobacteria bacterium]